ncbi:hypothetical protein PsorP6_001837 [Peronosclerospora sorghi]|uniref:Uncharacterized protein n=1 Tax=Peronosclerospora sorghi TaxID=230839 RepID=A0ACC0WX80_9STRA|nr:hypothetical protein PsorP6_001837 [Peronosclerospora sorghi]
MLETLEQIVSAFFASTPKAIKMLAGVFKHPANIGVPTAIIAMPKRLGWLPFVTCIAAIYDPKSVVYVPMRVLNALLVLAQADGRKSARSLDTTSQTTCVR